MLKLLPINEMPPIPRVNIPKDLYWVSKSPPLAGMRYPSSSFPWSHLKTAGFQYVVNLQESSPRYNPSPLTVLHATALQDLYGGGNPRDPVQEERRIREAAAAIIDKLSKGQGVVVHCVGGRGRTGTVLGCILSRLDVPAPEVISYLDTVHKARDKAGWPESPWQRELITRFRM